MSISTAGHIGSPGISTYCKIIYLSGLEPEAVSQLCHRYIAPQLSGGNIDLGIGTENLVSTNSSLEVLKRRRSHGALVKTRSGSHPGR